MSYTARYDKGNWKAICDVCGRLYKATMLQKRWDGLMCCDDDWEIRQPQDFVKGQADHQIAPWLRDESSNNFIPFNFTSNLNSFLSSSVTLTFAIAVHDYSNINIINGSVINKTTLG